MDNQSDKECKTCEGCGWDFKDKPPPYPPCKCQEKAE